MNLNAYKINEFLKLYLPFGAIYILSISIIVGSVSALLLWALYQVGTLNYTNPITYFFLPIVGLFIIFIYQNFSKESSKGNKLLIECYQNKNKNLPWLLAPLVFISTLLTHLTGGSAGREGTAVQIGAVVSNRLIPFFPKNIQYNHKLIITLGISAGFASVFGTPFAATIFAFELFHSKQRLNLKYFPLVILVAFLSHYTCTFWGIKHTSYSIGLLPDFNVYSFLWLSISAIVFGLVARFFVFNTNFYENNLKQLFPNPYIRVMVGGIVLAILFSNFDLNKYSGLGIIHIKEAFYFDASIVDFIFKLLLTGLTLAAGFKGGEVTPLFFIGATLGSFLSVFIPLPIGILAAMGFISVFGGATKTPLASAILGCEIFGLNAFFFFLVSAIISFYFSGKKSIYYND